MKKTILILLIYLNCNSMYSQNDSRAISLLNKVSEKIDSSLSFKISFTYTLENINEGINQNSDFFLASQYKSTYITCRI